MLIEGENNRHFEPLKRVYALDDPFYEEGNVEREMWAKHAALDPSLFANVPRDSDDTQINLFYCNISNCNSAFRNIFEYEMHYNSVHKHVCGVCKRVFPSNRLVEIHVLESHDSLFKVMAEQKKMYECLVEGCKRKFWNDHVRKFHLVDFHKYPRDFRFHPSSKKKKLMKSMPRGVATEKTLADTSECGLDIVLMDLENITMTNDEGVNRDNNDNNGNNKCNKIQGKGRKGRDFTKNAKIDKPKDIQKQDTSNTLLESATTFTSTTMTKMDTSNNTSVSTDDSHLGDNNIGNDIDKGNDTEISNQNTTGSKFKYSYSLNTKEFSFGHKPKRGGWRK